MNATSDPILTALRARGSAIRAVRYRPNRSVLLSVSRDGRTLNSHECFRGAPGDVVDALVRFIVSRRGTAAAREALEELRSWEGTRRGLERARRRSSRRRPAVDGPETAPLRELFDRLNRERFGGRLPAIPLRVSSRMTRSLGTIRYGGSGGDAVRFVVEIAISEDLLVPANVGSLKDTMLHEMAHAEAWLRAGHRGHGRPWRRVAERVGCTPRATCRAPVARQKKRTGQRRRG